MLFSKKIVFTTATTKKSLFQAIMDFTNIHHENISYLVVESTVVGPKLSVKSLFALKLGKWRV